MTPPTGTPVSAATLSSAEFAALAPSGAVTGVSIASPPVVSFQITDSSGRGIKGLGFTSQTSTAARPSLSNLAFSIAKLVPGTDGGPSKWVSYIVTSNPTTTTAEAPTRPTTDAIGTLVDNGDGTYKYTFYRDITKIKDVVAAATAPSGKVSDLGDLTYDATKLHRLVIQVGGNARGTGTNTADGSNSGVTAVPMGTPINIVFDWYPSTGKVVAAKDADQRELVSIENCNECHGKLAFHGGNRVDTRYCVMCHSDQRKYGQTAVTSTSMKFATLKETATVSTTTGITSYSYTPSTYVADGEVAGDFPIMIHKIHQGKDLVKENYNYANVVFNNKGYSMLEGGQKMCTKCHDNTKAAQADNWNAKPTRQACGACHDGINWATGGGSTLADKGAATAVGAVIATSGHIGKAQTSDTACALCHNAAAIKTYHQTANVTKHNPTVQTGLKNIAYEIKSADVNATTNDVTIVFKITADGSPVTLKAAAASMADPLSGFTGGPSFLLAYAQAQDGITTPADYNNLGVKQAQAISVTLASLLDTTKAADGSLSATADSSGYYTATLKGTGTKKFPVGAKMRAVSLQGYFTQVSPAAARHAISVVKEVTGDTVRRKVVDPDKCANCHEWFEGHGGNRVYQTQVCVMCHVPGLATSGRGISDAALTAYTFNAADTKITTEWKTLFGFDKTLANAALKFPVVTNNFKDLIHGIHAGRERVTPFVDARDRTPSAITLLDFRRMDFPGQLNKCDTCHVAGTYASVPTTALASTYESIDAAYAAGIAGGTATTAMAKTALSTANTNDTVTSPFTAACVSCHDSSAAQAHMATNNAMIKVTRATFQTNTATAGKGEACVTCHGAGKGEDVTVVHKK
ncbi:MAG TPA: OmcA/MtrC family decaheme c-type cytochrome [Burkholderiales bacterium]|nr:OmcA/MtrC family decaheme c-type cytochrome [Burkholderiales bacterium]